MQSDQLDAMLMNSEAALAGARAACERLGLDAQAGAIPILMNALAMAVADACGPSADMARLQEGANIAANQLFDLVTPQWVVRTKRTAAT